MSKTAIEIAKKIIPWDAIILRFHNGSWHKESAITQYKRAERRLCTKGLLRLKIADGMRSYLRTELGEQVVAALSTPPKGAKTT